jgi:hypothetical protein
LRVHLGHVLEGGGDAEVAALGFLELAADALDLVVAGAGPQRGGERAQRAEAWRGTQAAQFGRSVPLARSGISLNGMRAGRQTNLAVQTGTPPTARGRRSRRRGGGGAASPPSGLVGRRRGARR